MASTYSTSLKVQLMGNGEDSGTWGSITNTNWNLLEQAVAGVQTVTMANANYTLTNLNGVSDEARNMVLVVNGTNSGIYQIVAPLVTKFYVVSNQTTGGYAITIGGASGTLITVPNGTTVQVYCDGTNFYSAQTSSAGNFNVNGNLTVSGSLTVTGANNIIPSGTKMPFAQASAPTGWTQITDDTATNRMLRVVNATGGGTGGSASPILNNVVPSHYHGFTTGNQSNDHSHYFSASTGGMDRANPHSHPIQGSIQTLGTAGSVGTWVNIGTQNTYDTDINHLHSVSGNTGGVSANHTHSGNTDNGSSQTNWTPRYIDMIICSKN